MKRAGLPAALAMLVALVALSLPASAGAAFPGQNGRIAFEQITDPDAGAIRIDSVGPDGTAVRELTPADGNASSPAWSPDGRWIVYTDATPSGSVEIFRMLANGQRKTRLTRNRWLEEAPSWSPNGRWIVFAVNSPRAREIFIINRNGGQLRRLTRNRITEDEPVWSPDGRFIALTRSSSNGAGIITLMRPNGRVVKNVAAGTSPSWSPNGRWLTFAGNAPRTLGTEIFIVHRSGKAKRRLTEDGLLEMGQDLHPVWSPDGRWIAYARNAEEIRRVRPSGAGDELLFRARLPLGELAWQPRQGT